MVMTKGRLEPKDFGKYYRAEVWCWNCKEKQHVYILKGKPAHEVKKECSRCGCLIDMKTGESEV